MTATLGRFALVLHTHLPWVAHHGTWPVGEEWLHQAWATSYQPLFSMLRRRAALGHRDQLTLGVTPVVAAQWDDPCMVRAHHTWLGYWQTRAAGMATAPETAPICVGNSSAINLNTEALPTAMAIPTKNKTTVNIVAFKPM